MFANIGDIGRGLYAKLPWELVPAAEAMRCSKLTAITMRSAFLPTCAVNGRLQLRKTDNDSSEDDLMAAIRFSKAALEFLIDYKLDFVM